MSSGELRLIDLLLSLADQGEDLARDVALQAPDGLELGMAFGDALCDIGLGSWVGPEPTDGDDVQGAVGARSPPLLRRWRVVLPDEAGTGLTPQSAAKLASERRRSGVVAGGQEQLRGGAVTDGVPRHQVGCKLIDDGGDHDVEIGDLVVQFEIAACERLERDPIGRGTLR